MTDITLSNKEVNNVNNNKKPSRKRDWTPRTTTKILIATICMQLVTLVALIIRIVRDFI